MFARCFGDEAREGRLRWCGRVQRRNRDCKGRILREELAWQADYSKTIEQIYGCSEGGHGVGVREVDAEDRAKWRQFIDTVREERMKVSC